VLWLALALLVPLPLFGLQHALVPAGRALMLGAVCVLVVVLESSKGVVAILAAIFLVQAFLQLALLWLAAWLGAGASRGLGRGQRGAAVLLGVALAVALASSLELYRTPYRAGGIRASLLEVYE
jgi:hypothetical protein